MSQLEAGQSLPWWYMHSYTDHVMLYEYFYPIGLHWIMRLICRTRIRWNCWRNQWNSVDQAIKQRERITFARGFNVGYRRGYQDGVQHVTTVIETQLLNKTNNGDH